MKKLGYYITRWVQQQQQYCSGATHCCVPTATKMAMRKIGNGMIILRASEMHNILCRRVQIISSMVASATRNV